jgi:hypothetical protein
MRDDDFVALADVLRAPALATRLMASVVPRTKITSFTSGALMKRCTRWRAPS